MYFYNVVFLIHVRKIILFLFFPCLLFSNGGTEQFSDYSSCVYRFDTVFCPNGNTGITLCRLITYDYPECEEVYDFKAEYLFGDNLMIIPVTTPAVDYLSTLKA